MPDKHTLREVYLSKRLMLSEEEYSVRNDQVTTKAINLIRHKRPKNVHIFLPIKSKREIDTWKIIKAFEDETPNFIIPKTLPDGQLEHYLFDDTCKIEKNKWGIPEPIKGRKIEIDAIDLVFVPLVIADKYGNRIGYGKGYYDRFLSQINAHKVGLSLQPLLDEIPCVERTDVKLSESLLGHIK